MVLLCKQKALYVKCCIIANGVTDSQGDTLYTEDIKKIFTSFNNQDNFEVYHNDIPIKEVSLLENYISTADETIGTAVVPSGSWNAVVRVDNPDIKEALLTGEFKGVSLNNRIAEPCRANLTGQVKYEDVGDAECIIPLLISFVESGANGYGLHVMDYDAYIKKSKTVDKKQKEGVFNMDLKEFLEGLKSLINQAEDTPEEKEPAVEKEEKDPEDEDAEVKKEETPAEDEEESAEIKKEDETADEPKEDEDAEIEKADEETEEDVVAKLEERVAKLEEQINELIGTDEETTEETPDPTVEPEDEDTPKITKSEKVIIEDKSAPQVNYYEMTGRDPITGLKIRNQSKIL